MIALPTIIRKRSYRIISNLERNLTVCIVNPSRTIDTGDVVLMIATCNIILNQKIISINILPVEPILIVAKRLTVIIRNSIVSSSVIEKVNMTTM